MGGMYSLAIGMVAVALGFFGNKRHQRLSQTGMIFGAFSVLFVNLMNLGIIPLPSALESDKPHIVNSIHASIRAFEALKDKKLEDPEREKLLGHCRDAPKEARMVNIENVNKQVPGFADHYGKEFVRGMELLTQGYKNDDQATKFEGALLLDSWAVWNKENRKKLGRIEEPTPSLSSFMRAVVTG